MTLAFRKSGILHPPSRPSEREGRKKLAMLAFRMLHTCAALHPVPRRLAAAALLRMSSASAAELSTGVGGLPKTGGEVVYCNEDTMSQKVHGTTETPVQHNLRWDVDRKTADRPTSTAPPSVWLLRHQTSVWADANPFVTPLLPDQARYSPSMSCVAPLGFAPSTVTTPSTLDVRATTPREPNGVHMQH